jgi:hypothetical protein
MDEEVAIGQRTHRGPNQMNGEQVEAPNRRQRPTLNSSFLRAGPVLYNVRQRNETSNSKWKAAGSDS